MMITENLKKSIRVKASRPLVEKSIRMNYFQDFETKAVKAKYKI